LLDQKLVAEVRSLLEFCRANGKTIATAESCTGGLLAASLTEVAGSSEVFERGFVTYSNAAKEALLGVPGMVLEAHGAVSKETAEAMAKGALARSPVDYAVSITGIAGPGGATENKPVGLVYLAAASRAGPLLCVERRYGDIGRAQVRDAAVLEALALLRAISQSR
jgi:nicotinamide-nucleotide amidase